MSSSRACRSRPRRARRTSPRRPRYAAASAPADLLICSRGRRRMSTSAAAALSSASPSALRRPPSPPSPRLPRPGRPRRPRRRSTASAVPLLAGGPAAWRAQRGLLAKGVPCAPRGPHKPAQRGGAAAGASIPALSDTARASMEFPKEALPWRCQIGVLQPRHTRILMLGAIH